MFTNPCPLTATPDEVLTLDHLTRIEFVEIVHDKQDGIGKKEKMIYFLDNGTTRVLSVENLLIKTIKELKYVHYLLKVTDKVTEIWSIIILSNIKKRIMDGDDSYTRECIPAYTDLFGIEIPMSLLRSRNHTAGDNPIDSMYGYISLREDRMHMNNVRNIRATLYQIDDDVEK